MADTKISALPASTTPLAGTEVLPIVQSGATKQVSVANLTAGRSVAVGATTSTVRTLSVGGSAIIERFGATPQLEMLGGTNSTVGYSYRININQTNWTLTNAVIGSGQANILSIDNSTKDITVSASNLVQGTAAKGINFTANTPAAGMTSQLLNWYEEGTWTPTYQTTGGSFTYDIQTGSYTRIGNVVYCNFRLSTSAVTPGTGNVLLAGLPFTQKNNGNARGSFGIGDARNFGGDFPSGLVTEQIGTTTVSITYRTAANGGVTNLDASDLSTSGSFQNIIAGSFFYIV